MIFNKYQIKSRNIPIMYVSEIIGGFLFFIPILALYFEQSLFTITNVAIIFSVEAFAIVLFEIPTGAIADLFGRKKTLILANIAVLLALVFLFIGGSMIMFVLFAILNALGRSLSSGTISALIYDSLKQENKEKHFKKIIGTLFALWPLGASLGSIIGGYMAKSSLSTPVLYTFIPITIVLLLMLYLHEPEYEREDNQNIGKHIVSSSKIVIHNKQLIIIAVAGLIMMSFGETIHQLSPIFLKFKEIPIEYFGYVSAMAYGFSSLGHYFSHEISEKFGDKITLIITRILGPLLTFFATLVTGFVTIVLFTLPSIFFGIKNPIIDHLINIEVASNKRATVLSINNFIGQLGFAIVAPFIGYFADLYNINTTIQLSSILLLIVPILFIFLKKKS